MKILLVYQAFENLGVEYLSAALRREGHDTALLFDPALYNDAFLHKPFLAKMLSYQRDLVSTARDWKPDLIAFSVVSPTLRWALDLAKLLKEATGAPVLFGGLHPTAAPDQTLAHPQVDFVGVGEGEIIVTKLAEVIGNGGSIGDVPNLVWRENDNIVHNPLAPFMDVDDMPWPDKGLFHKAAPYTRFGYTIVAGRGCHMRCNFCCNSFAAYLSADGDVGFHRKRRVDDVINELVDRKARYGFDHVRWYDDCLTYDRDWFQQLTDRYTEEVAVPYWCFSNPDQLDEPVVKQLERTGCYELQMGVQTIYESTRRKVLNRRESTEHIRKAIALFKGTNISLAVDNILNIPGQTEEEIIDMVRFYTENRPDRVNAYWLTYFPGTKIIPIAEHAGALSESDIKKLYEDPDFPAMQINRPPGRKDLHRLHNYVLFTLLIPKNWHKVIQERRLYRFFPTLDPMMLLGIIYRLFSVRQFAHLEKRIFRRYFHFGVHRVLSALGLRKPLPVAERKSGEL